MTFTRAHVAAIGWTLLILAACTIPGRDLPNLNLFQVDKLAHAVFFAVLGWLWMAASTRPLPAKTRWTLLLGLAYAVLTEVYQGLLPFGRTPDPLDALANTFGLLVSVGMYRLWHHHSRKNTG